MVDTPTKFHLHKSFYAVSPDPFLSEAFGKGSTMRLLNKLKSYDKSKQ